MTMNPSTAPFSAQAETRLEELERTCFVIMPFGVKDVGGRKVDFTAIYEQIFEPAISAVTTPENKRLIPARTDMDAFSSAINQEMFEYIMYSRLAFADISGFNPNVFYEIGARHSVQESGTVLFRQVGHAIPFDIASIKVFEYDAAPSEGAATSRDFITRVLSESLKRNRLDSPVRLALRAQRGELPWAPSRNVAPAEQSRSTPTAPRDGLLAREVERFMQDAEEALRLGDLELARTNYWVALRFDPLNVIARMRLGLTLKKQGKHHGALEEFTTVTKIAPGYGEAWKEKGVVEGLIARLIAKDKRPPWLHDGVAALERATMLSPDDFDAWASLGGVLKNVRGDRKAALDNYAHAAKISGGHPYPLLNAVKLEAQVTGKINLSVIQDQLATAEAMRRAQTVATPPADTPWSFFDLAELRLYQKDEDGFLKHIEEGIRSCNADWQPATFRDSLKNCLMDSGIDPRLLSAGIQRLDRAVEELRAHG